MHLHARIASIMWGDRFPISSFSIVVSAPEIIFFKFVDVSSATILRMVHNAYAVAQQISINHHVRRYDNCSAVFSVEFLYELSESQRKTEGPTPESAHPRIAPVAC